MAWQEGFLAALGRREWRKSSACDVACDGRPRMAARAAQGCACPGAVPYGATEIFCLRHRACLARAETVRRGAGAQKRAGACRRPWADVRPPPAPPPPPPPQLTLDGRPRVYRDPTSGPSSRQAAWQGASAQLAIAPRRTMSRAASPIPLTHHPRVPCRPRRWRPGPKWPGWRGLPSSWAVADSGGSSCEVALARPAPGCARAQLRQGWAAAPLAVATAPPWPLLLSHTHTPKPTHTHTHTQAARQCLPLRPSLQPRA